MLQLDQLIFNEHLFGFFANSTNTFIGTPIISTCVIKLQSEDRLLLHSSICANPTRDDVLVSINSTTSINYSSTSWECPALIYYSHMLASPNNGVYRFTLTDENSELIQLNGLNVNLTLLLYEQDDSIKRFNDTITEVKDLLKYLFLMMEQKL